MNNTSIGPLFYDDSEDIYSRPGIMIGDVDQVSVRRTKCREEKRAVPLDEAIGIHLGRKV